MIKIGEMYIHWIENGEWIRKGPFITISPAGFGQAIGVHWMAYEVQYPDGEFKRISVPERHSIRCGYIPQR